MTNLLIKLFIKDGGSIETPAVRSAYGKMAGKVSIVCNMLLCIGKFLAGVISGSVSVTADAVNNLSDASSGVISLIGFKLSEKSADAEHPYGHGRYEYLAGFIVAALILVIGAELLRDSIIRIIKDWENYKLRDPIRRRCRQPQRRNLHIRGARGAGDIAFLLRRAGRYYGRSSRGVYPVQRNRPGKRRARPASRQSSER